jgi:DNA-binding GntR family transcriptional regulator
VAGHARADVVAPAAPGRRRDPDLTARLVETLRNRILSQQDPPGSRLREPDLARQLGVSRSRLREALSVLEQRGLIVREANRGAVVRRMTLEDIVHTLDVREGLEGVCTRLATRNVPPESWQDLVDLFGKPVEAMLDRGDVAGYLGAHAKLQQRLLEAARNPVLTGILQLLYDQTRSVTRRLVFATDRARQGLVEHRAVLAAMRAGDAKAAERLRREHLRSICEAAKRYHAFLI